jgi:hypothetical protein
MLVLSYFDLLISQLLTLSGQNSAFTIDLYVYFLINY